VKLSQVSIERPVLATVMSLVIILAGLIAVSRLPNREYPDVDPPVVAVTTVLPGAAPEVVETSVTQPLEDEIVGIAGVRHLSSTSSEQVSQITVEFELGRDVDLAANDVRDRVARVRSELPDDVEEPVVAKRDADASPILWLALSGADYDRRRCCGLGRDAGGDGERDHGENRQAAGHRRSSLRCGPSHAIEQHEQSECHEIRDGYHVEPCVERAGRVAQDAEHLRPEVAEEPGA
jgi:hypothetical protein